MVAGGWSIGSNTNGQNLMIPALLPNYARADLAFERGEGAWLWTVDGRRLLDFGSGIATASLGHGHPHLVKAIAEQAAKVMHTSNLYRIPQAERLAARLVEAIATRSASVRRSDCDRTGPDTAMASS